MVQHQGHWVCPILRDADSAASKKSHPKSEVLQVVQERRYVCSWQGCETRNCEHRFQGTVPGPDGEWITVEGWVCDVHWPLVAGGGPESVSFGLSIAPVPAEPAERDFPWDH